MRLILDEKIVLSENRINKIIHGTFNEEPIAAKTRVADCPFDREINFLFNCDHPNIVEFKSDVRNKESRFLIMELAHGNLHQHLGLKEFTTSRKRCLVEQISSGLMHIHSLNIVHRDIKATNILIMGPQRVVISDFAKAQRCDLIRHETDRHDVVQDKDYTIKSDVYLLGLLTFQIFADRKNIDMTWRNLGVEIEEANRKGQLAREVFEKRIWEVAVVDSVNQQPGKRPTATRFHEAFTE